MAIEWIFFDVGDVLFDEDPPHLLFYHSVFEALRLNKIEVSWDDFRRAIEASLRTVPDTAIPAATRVVVGDDALADKIYHEGRQTYERIREPRPYGILVNGMEPVLRCLRSQFRLGVIANQHPPVLEALKYYGIAPLFDVIGIDQLVGLSKPDPAFFAWGLKQAGCTGEQAIFVGDRPDNDVAPARSVGMKTVRLRRGIHYSLYDPRSPQEVADIEIRNVAEIEPAVMALARG